MQHANIFNKRIVIALKSYHTNRKFALKYESTWFRHCRPNINDEIMQNTRSYKRKLKQTGEFPLQ